MQRPLALLAACGGCMLPLATTGCSSMREAPNAALPNEVAPAQPAPCVEFGASAVLAEAMRGKPEGFAEARADSLRVVRPPAAQPSELPAEASRFMAMAAEAMSRNDARTALSAAREAARFAPGRAEPLEVQLLAHLAAGSVDELRGAVEQIRAVDAGNTIVLAFDGLSAAQSGDAARSLAALAWFFGTDALQRRGTVIPLPTAAGELEEQAAVAAIRLGRARAALEALEAASLARAGQEPALRALALMRAQVLVSLGRYAEAEQLLRTVAGDPSSAEPSDGLSMLAASHLDALRGSLGRMAESSAEAVAALRAAPDDDARLARFVRCIARLPAEARGQLRDRERRVLEGASPLRATLFAALLDPRSGGRMLEQAASDSVADRAALRHALHAMAGRNAQRCAERAAWMASLHPCDVDAIALAALSSGIEVDALLQSLESSAPQAAADALRSRVLARYGFVEDAYAVAASARARDRASQPALAACALAAAELADEALLADIDADPARAGIVRMLAACWLAVGRADMARARAAEALAIDSLDARAELIGALAASEDPEQRSSAIETLRRLATGRSGIASEAEARLAQLEPRTTDAVAPAAPRSPAARARNAAVALEPLRLPVALELRALAEELDGTRTAAPEVAKAAGAPDRAALARWSARTMQETPAEPARREVAAMLAGARAESIPAAPLSARFDALATATPSVRAADLLARAAARPRTAAALAAQIRAAIAAGDAPRAASILSAVDPFTVSSSTAARSLLAAIDAVASVDRAAVSGLGPLLEACISRLTEADADDLLAACRAALASAPSTVPAVAGRVAALLPPPSADGVAGHGKTLQALVAFDSDPFAAAQVAAALAAQPHFPPAVRGRFGTSATALFAAAGSEPTEVERFVRALVDEGAAPFRRDEEIAMQRAVPLAEILLRASSAFSMVGDEAGSEALLGMAVREDPELPGALNNLAYQQIERGEIGDATVAMAEKAATLAPDDPAVLDTVGFLRYHQGRLRDDAAGAGAISILRQALRLKPNDPSLSTLDHLGDALWRDGDQEGAIRCWQQIEQVAQLRYPPEPLARNLVEYQRREFGVELVDPAQYIRRNYGSIVDRARRKLEQVARGEPPAVADCKALR